MMLLKSSNCTFLSELQLSSLRKLNILTVEQLVSHADLETLSRNSKIPLDKLKLTYKYLVGQFAALPQTGVELLQKYIQNIFILKTGAKTIDAFLRGGVYSSEVTEIYGESSAGKTRLCLNITASLLVSLKSTIGEATAHQRVVYVDSCNNFCPNLLKSAIKAQDGEIEDDEMKALLQLMTVIRCENVFDLLDVIFALEKPSKQEAVAAKDNTLSVKSSKQMVVTHALVVENFNILFNVLRSSYTELNSHLHYTMRTLKYLCDYLNIVVIVTNTTSASRLMFNQTWNSLPNVRLLVSKCNGEHFLELTKHTRMPSGAKCKFEITANALV